MTENKILKSLEKLREKLGDIVYANFTDKWAYKINDKDELEHVLSVREEFKLSDIIEQFKNKEGVYNSLKITSVYREFEKEVTNHYFKAHSKSKFYKDTYDSYMEEWQKRHPGEDYKEWAEKIKKENELAQQKFLAEMAGLYTRPYQEMMDFFGPVKPKQF
jgi:hypothetical protein